MQPSYVHAMVFNWDGNFALVGAGDAWDRGVAGVAEAFGLRVLPSSEELSSPKNSSSESSSSDWAAMSSALRQNLPVKYWSVPCLPFGGRGSSIRSLFAASPSESIGFLFLVSMAITRKVQVYGH